MSDSDNRAGPTALANPSIANDEPKDSLAWSEARGEHGDLFQRHMIKPFIAAYAQFLLQEGTCRLAARRRMRTLYSKALVAATQQPEDPERILSEMAGAKFTELAVLDLGCGEAFLGRWLVRGGATYLGIDWDDCLLREAARKAREANLTTPVRKGDLVTLARDELPVLEDGGQPNLVTMTGVVDHIENFEEFMAALSRWAASNGKAPDFIVATLNPYFFRSLPDLDNSRADGSRPVRVPVHLAISDSSSWPYLRWPDEYERAFVDAGFHVLSSLSPSAGMLQAVTGKDIAAICGRREALDQPPVRRRFSDAVMEHVKSPVYVGPFILWLLRPRPRGALADSQQLRDIVSSLTNPAPVEELAAELLRLRVPVLPVLTLKSGDAIEHAGALGGRCYVVLEGNATRWQQLPGGGRASAQVFGPGDLIGEFEAGTNLVADRFKDDVAAGQPDCKLIVLEKEVLAQALARPEAELAARLFRTLRRRMSQYSWTWIPAHTGNMSNSVISDVARAILFGLSHEAQRGTGAMPSSGQLLGRSGPPVIVATPTELGQMIYGRPGGELKDSLNLLVREGIIDYGFWSYKKLPHTTMWMKDLAHEVWEAIVYESFDAMLGSTLPDHLANKLFRNSSTDPDKINMLLGSGGDKNLSQIGKFFLVDLATSNLGPPTEDLRRWLTNLAAIQSALYCQTQSSMFVRDVALLTEIASCVDTPLSMNAEKDTEDKEMLMVRPRWIEYADVTVSHVITQLREDRSFSTTAAAVGISTDVAANLDAGWSRSKA